MPGPPPKMNAVRRNIRPDWVRLPAAGRTAPPPPWPLGKGSPAELAAWRSVWSLPQALMWEKLRWFRTVARYVRILQRAEAAEASRVAMAEARQLEVSLGLTPKAMASLMWTVVDEDVAAPASSPALPRRPKSAREQTAPLAARLRSEPPAAG